MTQHLKEIPDGTVLAWNPCNTFKTVMAVGSTGSPSQVSRLDLVDLSLAELSAQSVKVLLSVNVSGNKSLSSLSWSDRPKEIASSFPTGIVAGGMSDGTIAFWDFFTALQQRTTKSCTDATLTVSEVSNQVLVASAKSADFPVTSIQFNSMRPDLVACGHSNGELNIINLENMKSLEIYEPGKESMKSHGNRSVTAVAWNKTVPHILGSTCSYGCIAIWNLKQRKASITIKDPGGMVNPSCVAWLPNQATQIIVAYDDQVNPCFQMWDLRNSRGPFREFAGHTRGITSMEFSTCDPCLMASCGKDNRTVCWVISNSSVSDVPGILSEIQTADVSTCVKWSPQLPGILATTCGEHGVIVDSVSSLKTWDISYVPKWYGKNASCSFGFTGKLVHFSNPKDSLSNSDTPLNISVVPITDEEVISRADEFETLLSANDLPGYCDKKLEENDDDEYEQLTWYLLRSMFESHETRNKIVLQKLGFDRDKILLDLEKVLGHPPGALITTPDGTETASCTLKPKYDRVSHNDSSASKLSHNETPNIETHSSSSNFFYPYEQEPVDPELFFSELGKSADPEKTQLHDIKTSEPDPLPVKILSSIPNAAEKTADGDKVLTGSVLGDCKTVNLSSKTPRWEKGLGLQLKRSILINQRLASIEVCVKQEQWADALLLAATSYDPEVWERVKKLYFKFQQGDKFLTSLGYVVSENWEELIKNSDLTNWKETLVFIISYVPSEIFPLYADHLALRLEHEKFDIKAAVVCYVLAGNFESASRNWIRLSLSTNHKSSAEKSLQNLVHKIIILRKATNYSQASPPVTRKVTEYAQILANSGRIVSSMKFLNLFDEDPVKGPAAKSCLNLRNRIYYSSRDTLQAAGIEPPISMSFDHVPIPSSSRIHVAEQRNLRSELNGNQNNVQDSLYTYPNSRVCRAICTDPSGLQSRELGYPQNESLESSPAFIGSQIYNAPKQPSALLQATPNKLYRSDVGASHQALERTYPLMETQLQQTSDPYNPPCSNVILRHSSEALHQMPTAINETLRNENLTRGFVGKFMDQTNPTLGPQSAQLPGKLSQPLQFTKLPQPPHLIKHSHPVKQKYFPDLQATSLPQPPKQVDRQPVVMNVGHTDSQFITSNPIAMPSQPFILGASGGSSLRPNDFVKPSKHIPAQQGTAFHHIPESIPSGFRNGSRNSITPVQPFNKGPSNPSSPQPTLPGGVTGSKSAISGFPYKTDDKAKIPVTKEKSAPVPPDQKYASHGLPAPWPTLSDNHQSAYPSQLKSSHTMQSSSVPGSKPDLYPVTPANMVFVKNTLLKALEQRASAEAMSPSSYEDSLQKLSQLFSQLESGSIEPSHQATLIKLCQAIEEGDYKRAHKMQEQLLVSWTRQNRHWLKELKRLCEQK